MADDAGQHLVETVQDFVTAKPARDKITNAVDTAKSFFGKKAAKVGIKPATPWHDSMVRKANDSFRQKAANEQKMKQAAPRKVVSATQATAQSKPAAKRVATKATARKQTD